MIAPPSGGESSEIRPKTQDRDHHNWTEQIEDFCADGWRNPDDGQRLKVPIVTIAISQKEKRTAAELIKPLGFGRNLALVTDHITAPLLGERIAKELETQARVSTIVLKSPQADTQTATQLTSATACADNIIAVGSGTINDLAKYAAAQSAKTYCVFATAASVTGYSSSTVSLRCKDGLKISLPARPPVGIFLDLTRIAAAPPALTAAGFGDSLCRSVAQADCWLSARLCDTPYQGLPFRLLEKDEAELNARAADLGKGDLQAIGYLCRSLILSGIGTCLTGTSHHASMGEHQISHYIDCFAAAKQPQNLHGAQVGVAALTMARLQQKMIAQDKPPVLKPTGFDEKHLSRLLSPEIAAQCLKNLAPKKWTEARTQEINGRLQEIWPQLRREISAIMIPHQKMAGMLTAAGAPITAGDLDIPVEFYRQAIVHAREMRNRFSFLDLAAAAGILKDFAQGEK